MAPAVIGLSLASTKAEENLENPAQISFYDQYLFGITIFVAIAAITILMVSRRHARKEACLTAWTAAFEDSHCYRPKIEDEEDGKNPEMAHLVGSNTPAVIRYRWAERIIG